MKKEQKQIQREFVDKTVFSEVNPLETAKLSPRSILAGVTVHKQPRECFIFATLTSNRVSKHRTRHTYESLVLFCSNVSFARDSFENTCNLLLKRGVWGGDTCATRGY